MGTPSGVNLTEFRGIFLDLRGAGLGEWSAGRAARGGGASDAAGTGATGAAGAAGGGADFSTEGAAGAADRSVS